MKSVFLIVSFFLSISFLFGQNLKPYTLAFKSEKKINTLKEELSSNLKANQIEVIGQYAPADNPNSLVIIITSNELKNAVNIQGGLSGFALALRIGIRVQNGISTVSFTTPNYWGNAYFQDKFNSVTGYFTTFEKNIIASLKACGKYIGTPYGSEDGLSAKDLQKYHYMMGMPYFEDNIVLKEFDNFNEAIQHIEKNISEGINNIQKVYMTDLPGKEIALYGFALGGEKGEKEFLPIIDIDNPKHTAFLPYEILVLNNKVIMLHGRYRIALSFPDLTMGTFSKIMSTPGNIEDLLKQVVE